MLAVVLLLVAVASGVNGDIACGCGCPGGWCEVDPPNNVTVELLETLKSTVEDHISGHFKEFLVVSYSEQIVAGINYNATVRVDVNTCIQIQVFLPLPREGKSSLPELYGVQEFVHCISCADQFGVRNDGKFEDISGCCYFFSYFTVTWSDASSKCQDMAEDSDRYTRLAEVGQGVCNDVKFMEAVAKKQQWYWFGANRTGNDNIWEWQGTGSVFPIDSNMWWYDEPKIGTGDCMLSWPDANSPAPRAYFHTSDCEISHSYVCQIL